MQLKNLKALEMLDIIHDTIIIDIRCKSEWTQTGIIEGSNLLTFFNEKGECDLDNWINSFQELVASKDKEFILVCAHGNRTHSLGNYLMQSLNYAKASHLSSGIVDWKYEGLKTIEID